MGGVLASRGYGRGVWASGGIGEVYGRGVLASGGMGEVYGHQGV